VRAWRLLAVACFALSCTGRPESYALKSTKSDDGASEPSRDKEDANGDLVEFDLTGGVHETPDSGYLFSLPASQTYVGLVREVERTANDPKVRGVLIRLGEAGFDWAHAEELGAEFARLRANGKKSVVCHSHGLDNATAWFVAQACSRIWVSPAGDVDTVGIAGQVFYLKGILDNLKIHADILHMGKYKSAGESLTRETASEEARQSLTAVLASIRQTWMDGYVAARSGHDVSASLEDGPFPASDAKTRGLIDDVGYEDDARGDLEKITHLHHLVTKFGAKHSSDRGVDVAGIVHLIAGGDSGGRPHIAVVPAEGSIAMSSSGGLLSDAGITTKSLTHVIRRLADDDSVKAVVLRINSPGGSALASDLLWHELVRLKKKKPLVASVGEMAASGGYYLACAANKIVANRTSIVGSIGVVGGKIVLNDALANFGVNAQTFPASTADGAAIRAAYLSPFASWDDATRVRVQRQMSEVYELFLSRVAEGRGLPVDAVRAVAEGRIWSGTQGHDLRLVDELGGLDKALDVARHLAHLDDDVPVHVDGIGEPLLESLLVGDNTDEATLRAAATRLDERRSQVLLKMLAPIRPFASALSPLVDGEPAVFALPFAFSVK